MEIKDYIKKLQDLNACITAVKWSRQFATSQEAWDKCERGDWMLWLIGKMNDSKPYSDGRKPLVATSLRCVRLAWGRMPQAGKDCIVLHEKWVNGEAVTKEDLEVARNAADADAAVAVADAAVAAAVSGILDGVTLKDCAGIVREDWPNIDIILEDK